MTMRSGSVLLAFNWSCPLYSSSSRLWERAGITPAGSALISARKTSARVPTLRAELFQRNLATFEI